MKERKERGGKRAAEQKKDNKMEKETLATMKTVIFKNMYIFTVFCCR